jgi:hypothetical protein
MKIPAALIELYLSAVTFNWFNDHDLPAEELAEYEPYVDAMGQWARERGDLPIVKLAYGYLLAHPEIELSRFSGPSFAFVDEDLRAILTYCWQRLWPEEPVPTSWSGPAVEITDEPWSDRKLSAAS